MERRTIMLTESRIRQSSNSREDANLAIQIMNRAIAEIENRTQGRITINSTSNSIEQGNTESIL